MSTTTDADEALTPLVPDEMANFADVWRAAWRVGFEAGYERAISDPNFIFRNPQ